MAASLFGLLDDIALLTKVAAKKNSGGLGDALALNAQQVGGVAAAAGQNHSLRQGIAGDLEHFH